MKERDVHNVLRALNIQAQTRVGASWVNAPCPFAPWRHKHGTDSNPSFGVVFNDNKMSRGNCFSCHWKGTLADLVTELESLRGVTYPEALHKLVEDEMLGISLPEWGDHIHDDEPLPEPYPDELFVNAWDNAWDVPAGREYLINGRPIGLHEEAVRSLDLRYDPDENRIVFPVRGRGGELYGFSGRSIFPRAQPKVRDYVGLPKKHLILGCHRWQQGKPVIMVEGLFAYAHLVSIGTEQFANVGAALGSVLTEEKASILRMFFHRVLLLFDPDEPGYAGIWEPTRDGKRDMKHGAVGKLLGHVPVSVPRYPEGCDDVDKLLIDEVEAMLETDDLIPRKPVSNRFRRT